MLSYDIYKGSWENFPTLFNSEEWRQLSYRISYFGVTPEITAPDEVIRFIGKCYDYAVEDEEVLHFGSVKDQYSLAIAFLVLYNARKAMAGSKDILRHALAAATNERAIRKRKRQIVEDADRLIDCINKVLE